MDVPPPDQADAVPAVVDLPKGQVRAAVGLWAASQGVALAAAAGGVHLWPHHPNPPESLALTEVVAVQAVVAGLAYSSLFVDATSLVVNVTLAIAFDGAASLLSTTPAATVVRCGLWSCLWIVGLAGWSRGVRRQAAQSCLTALAVLATLGGALLFYGSAESAAIAGQPTPDFSRFGPLVGGIGISVGLTSSWAGWGITAGPLISSAMLWTIRQSRRATRSGRRIHQQNASAAGLPTFLH